MAGTAEPEPDPDPDSARIVYAQICESHRAIVTFRAQLLALLPLASGVTLFVLFKDVYGTSKERILAPLGIFGFVVTFALLMHELRGIQDCTMLRERAKAIEKSLHIQVDKSHYRRWPPGKFGFVDEIGAAWIIYLAVLATWAFFALRGIEKYFDWWPSYWKVLIVFAVAYCVLLLGMLAAYEFWVYRGPESPRHETDPNLKVPVAVRRVRSWLFRTGRADAKGRASPH